MVRIHSPRPFQIKFLQFFSRFRRDWRLIGFFASVPIFVPTPALVYTFHCSPHRFDLRMDVPPRCRETGVPREVCQRVRVHVGRPSCQARVTECVKRLPSGLVREPIPA